MILVSYFFIEVYGFSPYWTGSEKLAPIVKEKSH